MQNLLKKSEKKPQKLWRLRIHFNYYTTNLSDYFNMRLSAIKHILKKSKATRWNTLRDDKINPSSVNWTRWFFPWWYLESVYRRMYPSYKPSLKDLEKFDKRYRQTTIFYWLGL